MDRLLLGRRAGLVGLAVLRAARDAARRPRRRCSSTASGRGRRARWRCRRCCTPICGLRPNSPTATTSVSFSRPRSSMSSSSAERPRSSIGQCRFFKRPEVRRVRVPRVVVSGSPLATVGQFTWTNRVPASISRRASSRLWPNVCGRSGRASSSASFVEVERVARLAREHQVEGLAVVFVEGVVVRAPSPGPASTR